jgi:hypothetical protein
MVLWEEEPAGTGGRAGGAAYEDRLIDSRRPWHKQNRSPSICPVGPSGQLLPFRLRLLHDHAHLYVLQRKPSSL